MFILVEKTRGSKKVAAPQPPVVVCGHGNVNTLVLTRLLNLTVSAWS